MKDSWCSKTRAKSGNMVSGGAARNVRIAAMGGMDAIIESVARDTLEKADAALRAIQPVRRLRLVSNR